MAQQSLSMGGLPQIIARSTAGSRAAGRDRPQPAALHQLGEAPLGHEGFAGDGGVVTNFCRTAWPKNSLPGSASVMKSQ